MAKSAEIVHRLLEDEDGAPAVDADEAKAELMDAAPTNSKLLRDLRAAFPDFDFEANDPAELDSDVARMFGVNVVAKDRKRHVPRPQIMAFVKRWYRSSGVPRNAGSGAYSYAAEWARRFIFFP